MDKKTRLRILIAINDSGLCDVTLRYFQRQGFTAKAVHHEGAMNQAMERANFDLIVLGLTLPGTESMSVCRRLRESGNAIPIIILAASANDEDRIAGLDAGADDCIGKPFNLRELLARVQAVIRRRPATLPGAPDIHANIIEFGKNRVSLGSRTFFRGNREIMITTGEFSLLKALLQNPRQPLSRDKLMELSRGREYEMYNRVIDVQISHLRKLVEDNPSRPRYIQTVWGFGYVFVPDGDAPPLSKPI
jgi:two-component system phosphate regulon response regulator OmpR